MKLLDTSVAVDHLRGEEPAVKLLSGLVAANEPLLASEVVRFELLAGVREDEVEALERFFGTLLGPGGGGRRSSCWIARFESPSSSQRHR